MCSQGDAVLRGGSRAAGSGLEHREVGGTDFTAFGFQLGFCHFAALRVVVGATVRSIGAAADAFAGAVPFRCREGVTVGGEGESAGDGGTGVGGRGGG